MAKQIGIATQWKILSDVKEQILDTGNNMDNPQKSLFSVKECGSKSIHCINQFMKF